MGSPTPSLLTRLTWAAKLYLIKALVHIFVLTRRAPPSQRPTYTKKYSSLPNGLRNLTTHIWIPSTYKPGDPPLPLLIDIHGGGFCIGHPAIDDGDNALLCHKHGICVVSVNYRKAPGYPFPVPVEDCAAMIGVVLRDDGLPVDKSKVAVAGYSAGGTLALAATQLNGLEKRIKGVVSIYPAAEPGRGLEKRLETAVEPPQKGRKDILIGMAPAFNWAYIPTDQDLRDPLLAPLYAERHKLPQKLFILGAEYDMLCAEARETAEHLAEAEAEGSSGVKREELGGGRDGWTCGNVTWEEIKGVEHGFNQRFSMERDLEVKSLWEKKTVEMHERIAEWLFREVYS